MEKHQVETLQALSRVKELAENGNIQKAISEIAYIEPKLNAKERSAIMNIFAIAVVDYSLKI